MTASLPRPVFDLPAIYAVVGERGDDSACLLAQGSGGQHYAYRPLDGAVSAIEPDEAWRFDGSPPRPRDERVELAG